MLSLPASIACLSLRPSFLKPSSTARFSASVFARLAAFVDERDYSFAITSYGRPVVRAIWYVAGRAKKRALDFHE
jgi:hypothetical protein